MASFTRCLSDYSTDPFFLLQQPSQKNTLFCIALEKEDIGRFDEQTSTGRLIVFIKLLNCRNVYPVKNETEAPY